MKKVFLSVCFLSALLMLILVQLDCSKPEEKAPMTKEEQIARGKYLVNLGGCNDCHSPKMMTVMGPVPDTTKLLSGHPAAGPMEKADPKLVAPGKWILVSQDLTGWFGPWGTSFSANITPDSSTGLGAWSEQNFISTMRTGKHLGTGRNILPPMPWDKISRLTDDDLKAMFAYLQSIPAVSNMVPNPVPPDMKAPH